MNTLVYELMKNYGFNETKMEVVLYTLLANNKDFRTKFLKEAFKTPFKYDTADIKTEVSRTSMRQGRTDVEITDEQGRKFILELKVNMAYPEPKQLEMYESIENIVEVATLTNINDHGKLKHKNTTWKRTADIVNEVLTDSPFYHFLNDFGPMNGKGWNETKKRTGGRTTSASAIASIYDTLFTFVSNKEGNFVGHHTGLSVLRDFNKYFIPAPTNEVLGKNYKTLNGNIQYFAFRYTDKNDQKGMTRVLIYKVKDIEILSPEEINESLGDKVVFEKDMVGFTGDHYSISLELIEERKLMFGYSQGMLSFYANIDTILDDKFKSVFEMRESMKEKEA